MPSCRCDPVPDSGGEEPPIFVLIWAVFQVRLAALCDPDSAAVSGLASWAGFAYRLDLAASGIALIVSISMLISAFRSRNRPPLTQSI